MTTLIVGLPQSPKSADPFEATVVWYKTEPMTTPISAALPARQKSADPDEDRFLYACRWHEPETINGLIAKRSAVTVRSWDVAYGLGLACLSGNIDVVKLLVRSGLVAPADIGKYEFAALRNAAANPNIEFIHLLREAMGLPNPQ
jgi:ankyrin repeat protein